MRTFKIILILIGLQLVTFSCHDVCNSYLENVFRPLNYNMVVKKKYIDSRWYRVIGKKYSGIIDTTQEDAIFKSLYEQVEIGDTLLKEKGELKIFLKKKDCIIEFPVFCGTKGLLMNKVPRTSVGSHQ